MQDRRAHEGERPFVVENVSDFYEIKVSSGTPNESVEVEPNDVGSAATSVRVGAEVTGRFGWHGDVDVVCALPEAASSVRARFVVSDAEGGTRDLGAVLELMHIVDEKSGTTIRLHRRAAMNSSVTHGSSDNKSRNAEKLVYDTNENETDKISPWISKPFDVSSGKQHCVRLRLTGDPWAGSAAPLTPPVSPEQWKVRVDKVD